MRGGHPAVDELRALDCQKCREQGSPARRLHARSFLRAICEVDRGASSVMRQRLTISMVTGGVLTDAEYRSNISVISP
jgi:hypothetical protein